MLYLVPTLANVVRQGDSETKFQVFTIFKKNYKAIRKCFLVLNATFDVRWTNLFHGLCHVKGRWHFWQLALQPNPYIKSTIVLFIYLLLYSTNAEGL